MTNEQKTTLFETTSIPVAVAKLGIPTIIGSIVSVLYNLADTYFVGAINDPIESAAVTLGAPLILAFNAVTNLFGVGCSSYMSRALGKKDIDSFKKTSSFGFYCALFLSVLYSVISFVLRPQILQLVGSDASTNSATAAYIFWTIGIGAAPSILHVVLANMIRSEGESLHASIGTMLGCLLNVALDPIFIMPWGLGMKASGAGCATCISNTVSCLYFFIFLIVKRGKTYVSINPKLFGFDKTIVKEVFSVGIPASIQNLLNVTGMTILNNFAAAFGTDAVAAIGITHKIYMVPMYFSMGLGQGVLPLVGYNYSSGNAKRMKETILFTGKVAIGLAVLVTAILYFNASAIVELFMKNEGIVFYGNQFLKAFCLGVPFLCIDFLGVAIFQATGMGKYSFIFAVLRKVVLEIPAMYILNKIWPLYGLCYSQLCAEVVLAVAAIFVIKHIIQQTEKGQSK